MYTYQLCSYRSKPLQIMPAQIYKPCMSPIFLLDSNKCSLPKTQKRNMQPAIKKFCPPLYYTYGYAVFPASSDELGVESNMRYKLQSTKLLLANLKHLYAFCRVFMAPHVFAVRQTCSAKAHTFHFTIGKSLQGTFV